MNCIYETQKGQCGVTGDLECREPCGFKKTAEDMEKGKKLVHKRIRGLSEGEPGMDIHEILRRQEALAYGEVKRGDGIDKVGA